MPVRPRKATRSAVSSFTSATAAADVHSAKRLALRACTASRRFSSAESPPNRFVIWNERPTPAAVMSSGFELDLAGVRWKEPRQEIEGGRLAGAVGADQRVQRAVPDRQVDAVDGVNAAESLDETACDQHRRRARAGAAIDLRQSRGLGDSAPGHRR